MMVQLQFPCYQTWIRSSKPQPQLIIWHSSSYWQISCDFWKESIVRRASCQASGAESRRVLGRIERESARDDIGIEWHINTTSQHNVFVRSSLLFHVHDGKWIDKYSAAASCLSWQLCVRLHDQFGSHPFAVSTNWTCSWPMHRATVVLYNRQPANKLVTCGRKIRVDFWFIDWYSFVLLVVW